MSFVCVWCAYITVKIQFDSSSTRKYSILTLRSVDMCHRFRPTYSIILDPPLDDISRKAPIRIMQR